MHANICLYKTTSKKKLSQSALSSSHSYQLAAMFTSKVLIASLLISVLLLQHVYTDEAVKTGDAKSGVHALDCGRACAARCRLSSRQNLCKRACGTCCRRCSCVPPGTSGNQESCACYYNMTTHGGRRKCP